MAASTITMTTLGRLIVAIIAINLILFALTFNPAFSGIGVAPGLADRLLGNYRVDGWRADIVWMFASTAVIFFLGLRYLYRISGDRSRVDRIVLSSCVAWLVCFVVYASYVLMHMMG